MTKQCSRFRNNFRILKTVKTNTLRNFIRKWSGKTSTCSWVHWVLVALPVWVSLVLSVGCVTCMGIPGTECWLRYLYGYPWYWVLVALPVWVSLVECTECWLPVWVSLVECTECWLRYLYGYPWYLERKMESSRLKKTATQPRPSRANTATQITQHKHLA